MKRKTTTNNNTNDNLLNSYEILHNLEQKYMDYVTDPLRTSTDGVLKNK